MTENEAKRLEVAFVGGGRNAGKIFATQAAFLEELEKYRAIGTVEEIKSGFNENRKAGYKHGYSDGYKKAIDEFAERIKKRIKEEVSLLEQERNEAREYDDEQVIFAVNNQLRAFDYSLRVIAEELKGGE